MGSHLIRKVMTCMRERSETRSETRSAGAKKCEPAVRTMKLILVVGFPHCGTTVLRSKLGTCENVMDLPEECQTIAPRFLAHATAKNHVAVVAKCPTVPKDLLDVHMDPEASAKHKGYEIVFIMRDPRYVFDSLATRFRGNIPKDHGCDVYERTAAEFLRAIKNPIAHVHTVKYEDLFADDFRVFRRLVDALGLVCPELHATDDQSAAAPTTAGVGSLAQTVAPDAAGLPSAVPAVKPDAGVSVVRAPERTKHETFRSWQIKQPFHNMNLDRVPRIPEAVDVFLKRSEIVRELYPTIFPTILPTIPSSS